MSSRHSLPHNLKHLRPTQAQRLFEVAHASPVFLSREGDKSAKWMRKRYGVRWDHPHASGRRVLVPSNLGLGAFAYVTLAHLAIGLSRPAG